MKYSSLTSEQQLTILGQVNALTGQDPQKIEQDVVRDVFADDDELRSNLFASLVEYLTNQGILINGPFDAAVHPTATINDLDFDKIRYFVGMARERRKFLVCRLNRCLANTNRNLSIRCWLCLSIMQVILSRWVQVPPILSIFVWSRGFPALLPVRIPAS